MSQPEPPASAPVATAATWQDWANRTTAILAVLAALSSGRWGASNLQAILEQGKVNDTWSYFQAKSVKQHAAAHMRDLAEAMAAGTSGNEAAALNKLRKDLDDEATREGNEKAERMAMAHEFEKSRDKLVERGFWFELSFAALQLGVILSTIATGAKTKGSWIVAIVFGVIGLAVLFNGFHPIVHAPESLYQGAKESMSAPIDK